MGLQDAAWLLKVEGRPSAERGTMTMVGRTVASMGVTPLGASSFKGHPI